jgi:hypothetical protein
MATAREELLSIDFSDGKLRVTRGDDEAAATDETDVVVTPSPASPERMTDAQAWDALSNIGRGAFPDTRAMHQALSRFVWIVALAIPLAMLVLGIAIGESAQTVFYMTFAGAVVGAMLRASVRS